MKLNTDMRVNRVTDEVWEIPVTEKAGMLVPARIYATPGILQTMDRGVFDQVTNVACLLVLRAMRSACRTGIGAMGFPSGRCRI